MNPQATLSLNRFYCVMMAGIQLGGVAFVAMMGSQFATMPPPQSIDGLGAQLVAFFAMLFIPLLMGGLFSTVLIFAPKTKFWWWAHLFHQIMGLGSCIFFAVPLIIFWSREPLMEIYFGRKRVSRRKRKLT
ncbi:MAG: hypothetical protein KF836_09525 [Fimbriimonadaceae bacterium]|nr:hypothetical protein [Fimbriimonadaceae bacterium]